MNIGDIIKHVDLKATYGTIVEIDDPIIKVHWLTDFRYFSSQITWVFCQYIQNCE